MTLPVEWEGGWRADREPWNPYAYVKRSVVPSRDCIVVVEPDDLIRALVERWLQDQQQWQRTVRTYLDSMITNEEFLTHLGNAMRGSLLAGKPYPTAAASPPERDAAADDRLDQVLFALHQLQGQLQDLMMTLESIKPELPLKSAPARSPERTSAPKRGAFTRRASGTRKDRQ